MRRRRGKAKRDLDLCNGPGKLTEALGITLAQNNSRLDRNPFQLLAPEGEPSRHRHEPPSRHHESRRAPLALLSKGEPQRLPAPARSASSPARARSAVRATPERTSPLL